MPVNTVLLSHVSTFENHRQMEQEIYVVIFQRMSTVKLSLKNPYHYCLKNNFLIPI